MASTACCRSVSAAFSRARSFSASVKHTEPLGFGMLDRAFVSPSAALSITAPADET
ncbi:hypothetical protein [Streptomyces abikoensis]|uniref:hypothetical protein n=1 Tax=Streptomyces abikoensis TaxID=97398 RepID=UPI00340622F0